MNVLLNNEGAWWIFFHAVDCLDELYNAIHVQFGKNVSFSVKEFIFFPCFDGFDVELLDGDLHLIGQAFGEKDLALSSLTDLSYKPIFVFERSGGDIRGDNFGR